MFATQAQNPGLVSKNISTVNQVPLVQNMNPNDFNTMQNLFATQAQNPTLTNTNFIGINQGSNDFNTMQNLFATGVQGQNIGGISTSMPIAQPNISLNNPVSFPPPS